MSPPSSRKVTNITPVITALVSLTCIISKCMEHILVSNNYIMQHLDSNKILYGLQHGFRKNFSSDTQLLSLFKDLSSNPSQTDLIIMDFVKLSIRSRIDVYNISSTGTPSEEPHMPGFKHFCKGDRRELFLKGRNPPPIMSSPVCPKVLFLAPYYV